MTLKFLRVSDRRFVLLLLFFNFSFPFRRENWIHACLLWIYNFNSFYCLKRRENFCFLRRWIVFINIKRLATSWTPSSALRRVGCLYFTRISGGAQTHTHILNKRTRRGERTKASLLPTVSLFYSASTYQSLKTDKKGAKRAPLQSLVLSGSIAKQSNTTTTRLKETERQSTSDLIK